jgi:hypothetical protein
MEKLSTNMLNESVCQPKIGFISSQENSLLQINQSCYYLPFAIN